MSVTGHHIICAIATPPGNGAIALIRVSGSSSHKLIKKIFRPRNKQVVLKPNSVIYGEIFEGKKVTDDVLLTVFCSPASYTGEDSFEITCHGSVYIQKEIIRLLLKNEARLAEPGEFTQRAFLNGKMDLSQAEAVADLIASDSEASHRIAMQQMRGGIKNELDTLREKLLGFASLIELELDFSEEDVEFADRKGMQLLLHEIEARLKLLVDSFERGNAMKSGISVVIAGPVNSGKSTLLNALLNEERAIVSHIPGTTRDVVEDSISIKGIKIRFADTAGIRKTINVIENLGIDRTYQQANKASLILFLSTPDEKPIQVRANLGRLLKHAKNEIPVIHIINKSEGLSKKEITVLQKELAVVKSHCRLFISAKFRTGLEGLTEAITEILQLDKMSSGDVAISNLRHLDALKHALDACKRTRNAFTSHLTTDLVAQEIRQINHHLGTITGQISDREILGRIFERFCVGK
jgi:tRNA modification GTPase